MARPVIDIQVQGVRKVLRLLREDPVHARPWTKALQNATDIAYREAQHRAPKQTGALESSIRKRLQKAEVPLWAKVVFPNRVKPGGKRGKGFRYGGALEGSSKFHYRSGPFMGQPTKGWFSGSLDKVQQQINSILARAAKEIESRWAS